MFKSNNASVSYKICVKFPGGQKLCANNQHAPNGTKVLNTITSNVKGVHTVEWWVGGNLVGALQLRHQLASSPAAGPANGGSEEVNADGVLSKLP